MDWTSEEITSNEVTVRDFRVERGGHPIPGRRWRPVASADARPLVLLGHGGSGHKGNERMSQLGALFAVRLGAVAVAIDGPVHGERGPVTDSGHPAYRAMWQGDDPVGEMIADWRAVLSAEPVDARRIGYWRVSMGTMFGLPLVASEARIRVAVLGKAGMSGTSVERSGIDGPFARFAPRVSVPVLFTMQWDDERFERGGQLDLFDRLGCADKRLQAYPGAHVDNGPDAFDAHADFLARYLALED